MPALNASLLTNYQYANLSGSAAVPIANGGSGQTTAAAAAVAIVNGNPIAPSSVLATGIVDGKAPITITSTASNTLGGTYKSGYTFNSDGSAAVTYTLPTASAGLQYCVGNYTGATGTITVQTSASGQFIDNEGANTASGGYVISGGALGDAGCFVGITSTQWKLYSQGTTSWATH